MKSHLFTSIKIIGIFTICLFTGCSSRDDDAKVTVINPDYLGSYYDQKKQRFWLWGSDGNLRWSDNGKLWHNVSTETSASVVDLQKDESSNLILAVTAEGKILRSKNSGDNWQMISIAGIKTAKKLIYVAEFKRWFLLGDAGKLWTSTDKGTQWKAIDLPSAFTTYAIESMLLTSNKKRLLIGGNSGLTGYSDDQGESWNITRLEMETPITGFYLAGDRIIATAAYGKFLTSDASGTQWSLLETDGKAFFTDGIYLPKEDVMLITTHNGNLLKGTPKTNQWQMASLPFRNSLNYLTHIWSEPSGLLRIVGHGGTHLTSNDAGKTWQAQNESSDFYFENIQENSSSKKQSTWVGFGRNGLLGISHDQGVKWTTIFPQTDMYIREALLTPKGSWILAGELGVILRSENKGKDWKMIDVEYIDPVTPPSYRALVLSRDKQSILAAGPTGSILRSQDDGQSWQTVLYSPFDQGEAFTDLKIDASGKIIALEAWGRHKISVDNGSSWKSLSKHEDERALWQLTLLPKNADQPGLWLAAGQAGLVSTSHDGENWQTIDVDNLDWFGVYADEANRQVFILGAQGAIYRSKDNGQSWYPFNTPTEVDLRRMISVNSEILLAVGGDGVILRSADKGDSWNKIDSGIKDEIRHMEMDTQGNIYAVAKGGQLLKSQDSGNSWKIIETQTQAGFRDLIIDQDAILVTGQRISVIRK